MLQVSGKLTSEETAVLFAMHQQRAEQRTVGGLQHFATVACARKQTDIVENMQPAEVEPVAARATGTRSLRSR